MALTLGGGSSSVSSRCHGCALPTQSPRPAARSPMWVAQAATHPEAESPPAASLWHQAGHMLPKLGGGADTGQTFPAQREKRKRRQAGQAPTVAQTFRREDSLGSMPALRGVHRGHRPLQTRWGGTETLTPPHSAPASRAHVLPTCETVSSPPDAPNPVSAGAPENQRLAATG